MKVLDNITLERKNARSWLVKQDGKLLRCKRSGIPVLAVLERRRDEEDRQATMAFWNCRLKV